MILHARLAGQHPGGEGSTQARILTEVALKDIQTLEFR